MTTIRCPHCGTANRSGSNFCNSCGAELRASAATPPPTLASLPDGVAPAASRPGESKPSDHAAPSLGPAADAELPWLADAALWRGAEFSTRDELADPEFAPPEFAQSEFDDEIDGVSSAEPEPVARAGRLIVGVQGLLDPLRIAGDLTDEPTPMPLPRRDRPVIWTASNCVFCAL